MNIHAYTLDSLRRLVRALLKENRELKQQLKINPDYLAILVLYIYFSLFTLLKKVDLLIPNFFAAISPVILPFLYF